MIVLINLSVVAFLFGGLTDVVVLWLAVLASVVGLNPHRFADLLDAAASSARPRSPALR